MVMIASAVCNDGVAMRPQLVEEVENHDGITVETAKSKSYKTLFTNAQVNILSDFMRETVEAGTASRLNKEAYTAYGKTGTAQINDGSESNSLFLGFAEQGGKAIAICVVIENMPEGSTNGATIAKKVFDAYYE
jgi:peptidoglycan glycosyltransferase